MRIIGTFLRTAKKKKKKKLAKPRIVLECKYQILPFCGDLFEFSAVQFNIVCLPPSTG